MVSVLQETIGWGWAYVQHVLLMLYWAWIPGVLGAALLSARYRPRLDEKDLILARDGRVMLAYPFAGIPTAFQLIFGDGRERYAVCAIDALGVPPMVGQPVTIRSSCHHCGAPIEIRVRPDGPVAGAELMVWVGQRGDMHQKACTSICLTLNFFRSKEHLSAWREIHPEIPGAAAFLEEAFKLGAKIFGELLHDVAGGSVGGGERKGVTA